MSQKEYERPLCYNWFKEMLTIVSNSDHELFLKSNFQKIFTKACKECDFKLFLTCCASVHELYLKQEAHETFEDESD